MKESDITEPFNSNFLIVEPTMLYVQIEKSEAKRKIKVTCPTCRLAYELSLAYAPRVCHMCSSILPNIPGIINSIIMRINHYKET